MVSVALAGQAFANADWWIVGWCGILLAYTVLGGILTVIGNLVADIAITVADPRVRFD